MNPDTLAGMVLIASALTAVMVGVVGLLLGWWSA